MPPSLVLNKCVAGRPFVRVVAIVQRVVSGLTGATTATTVCGDMLFQALLATGINNVFTPTSPRKSALI